MKKIIWKFGFISFGLMLLVLFAGYLFGVGTDVEDFKGGEIVGYTSMIVALFAIYFAVRQYRDDHNGGVISFGKAFKVGILIALFPSVLFGLFNHVYIEVIDPDFMVKYTQYTMEQEAGSAVSMDEVMAELDKQKAEMPLFFNTYFQDFLMFITVFIIGLIMSTIFAVALKRNTPKDDSGDTLEVATS